MQRILLFILTSISIQTLGFRTPEVDSMWAEASKLPHQSAMQYLADNAYNVFNKNMKDGLDWTEQMKLFAIQAGDKKNEGKAHLTFGVIWYLHGNYENAVQHYQKALDIFESLGDPKWIGRTYNELSVYVRKQKQYEKSLEYLNRAYNECSSVGDDECVETSFNNRGVVYEMMGKLDLAIKSYHKARQIAVKNDNRVGLSYIYNNLAEVYRLKKTYDSSKWYIDKSLEIRKALGDRQGVAINWENKGELYVHMEAYEKAIPCLDSAIRISKEIGYWDLLRQSHELSAKSHKALGNIKRSFYHLERTYKLKDSLLNEEKLKSLSEMEVKYETQKVQKEKAIEQQKRSEAELEVSNRNKWIYAISGILLTFVLFSMIVILYRSKKARAEKDAAILQEKERGMEAVFEATEEERQRIAKDLHDGVGQQMSGLKMAWSGLAVDFKSKLGDEAKKLDELTKILDETASEVREISHQMMPKVLKEYGLIEAICEMLEKSLRLSPIDYNFEHFNFEGRLDRRIELSLYRVTQELINNVIKHSGANFVSVQIFMNRGYLILIVEDNGRGIDQSLNNEGHGLLNIKSRLDTVKGSVNYEASPNAGTTATIRIKIQ